ncbi:MAG: ArsR family transcriptional regulator [Methanobacteriota archaeon]|nr:MAG: ArsR family transcriptional regulator [Euryarchaeota archaeon]
MGTASSDNDLMDVLRDISSKFDLITDRLDNLDGRVNEITKSIDQDLKLNYLNSVVRFLEREAIDLINTMSCSYKPETEIHCKSWVTLNIKGYLDNLSMGNLTGAYVMLKQFLGQVKKNSLDVEKNIHCRSEWLQLLDTLENHLDFIQEISTLFVPKHLANSLDEGDFDPDFVSDMFVVPLSHPLRIKIIHSLMNSSKRFTALKKELDIKNTGLLVHHMKPLTDAGFVTQNYKKEYLLTERGHLIARFLSQIDASLRPNSSLSLESPVISNLNVTELKVIND